MKEAATAAAAAAEREPNVLKVAVNFASAEAGRLENFIQL